MLDKNKIKTFSGDSNYTAEYSNEAYVQKRIEDADRLLSQISNKVKFKKEQKILDVGCGTGEIGRIIKKKFGSNVHGLDINSTAVARAQENGVIAKVHDVESKWPYKENTFDAIFCIQMIEHMVNPDFFLQESRRVLKKNGYVIITTPNLAAWFNRILLLLGFQPFFTEVSTIDKTCGLSFTRRLTTYRKPMGHLRVFTLKALEDILHIHRYKIKLKRGSAVSYFPTYISFVDSIISNIPSFASDLVIVARKTH